MSLVGAVYAFFAETHTEYPHNREIRMSQPELDLFDAMVDDMSVTPHDPSKSGTESHGPWKLMGRTVLDLDGNPHIHTVMLGART